MAICRDCKFYSYPISQMPCLECSAIRAGEGWNGNFQLKDSNSGIHLLEIPDCRLCKHEHVSAYDDPCLSCTGSMWKSHNNFKPKEPDQLIDQIPLDTDD